MGGTSSEQSSLNDFSFKILILRISELSVVSPGRCLSYGWSLIITEYM